MSIPWMKRIRTKARDSRIQDASLQPDRTASPSTGELSPIHGLISTTLDLTAKSSSDPSHYEILPPDYFRLIILHSGPPSSPLVAHITPAPLLQERQTPYYEALSYTWGSYETNDILQINSGGFMKIRRNLRDALIRLRYPDRPRTLWVDALCINQDDMSEKNHQVALMTKIYSIADKVLVYLGEEYDDSAEAMEVIRDFEGVVSGNDAHIVEKLLRRSWFTRIWVVQEVARSRSAVVICGTECVSWDCFARWPIRAASRKREEICLSIKAKSDIPGILNYASGYTPSVGSESLLQLLHENRSALAANERDKIFGLLGLMADIGPYQDLIDYTKPAEEIYLAVAWQILTDTQSLRILSAAGCLATDDILDTRRCRLPSWVPDWSYAGLEASLALGRTFAEPFNAGGRHCSVGVNTDKTVLNVRGVRIATITSVGDVAEQGSTGFLADESLKSWESLSTLTQYCRRQSYSEAEKQFLETVSASPTSAVISLGNFFDVDTIEYDHPILLSHVRRRIARVTFHRRFFIAEHRAPCYEQPPIQRYMGLGPESLRAEDIIVVLLGGPVPYVLRPVAGGSSFQLIGEAYVHGIMNGEALHHVREEVEAGGCMLPPTSVQRCFAPVEEFKLA